MECGWIIISVVFRWVGQRVMQGVWLLIASLDNLICWLHKDFQRQHTAFRILLPLDCRSSVKPLYLEGGLLQ